MLFEDLPVALLVTAWSYSWHLLGGAAATIAAAWITDVRRRNRRVRLGLLHAGRTLSRVAPWAAASAAILWLVARVALPRTDLELEPVPLSWTGIGFVLCGFATCGAALLLAAGRLESRGRLRSAGRLVRSGGMTTSAALGLFLVLGAPRLLAGASAPLAVAWVAFALSAGAGLLAALSRKPRPSGSFCVVLYAVGSLALALAPTAGN